MSSSSTHQFVKLDETNYILWFRQIRSHLRGAKLWGYVAGTVPCPPTEVPVPTAGDAVPTSAANLQYEEWQDTDQQVVSILLSSLTPKVARLTTKFDTSKDIWDCLARHFAQTTVANSTSLRIQLFEMQKGSLSVDDYLNNVKSLADALEVINEPVSEKDLVVTTLTGLGPDYVILRTAIGQSERLPSFEDLRARILAFDSSQRRTEPAPVALYTNASADQQPRGSTSRFPDNREDRRDGRDNREDRRDGRGGRGRGSGGYGRGRRGRGRGRDFYSNSYGQYNQAPAGFSPWTPRPWAQGMGGPGPVWCPNCQSSQHGHKNCPHRFQGPQVAAPFAGSHTYGDLTWYPDTGATHHMTNMPLVNPQPYGGPHNVYMGDGSSMPISHTGTLPLSLGNSNFSLRNVFRIPSIRKNLLSVARFTQDNLVVFLFAPHFYRVYCLLTGRLLFQGPCENGLYPLRFSSKLHLPQALSTVHSSLWHNRLGHPSSAVLSRLGSQSVIPKSSHLFCTACAVSKSQRLPFSDTHVFTNKLFSIIHSDVWQSPILSNTGYKYYVLFTDEYSRYTWIYPMRQKNEVFTHFQTLVATIQTIFHSTIQYLQSDNGTEYVNSSFSTFCASTGIQQRFSCPYTPQQNGLAERKHRHIANITRTILHTAGAPPSLWVEAALTAVYLINLLPSATIDWDSPHQRLYNSPPPYSSLRVFGCSCFPYLGHQASNKLSSRSVECVFLGYSPLHKGYRCLNPYTGRVYVSRHVLFNETHFPYKHMQIQGPQTDHIFDLHLLPPLQAHLPSHSTTTPGTNSSIDDSPATIPSTPLLSTGRVPSSSPPPVSDAICSSPLQSVSSSSRLLPTTLAAPTGVTSPSPLLQYRRRHPIARLPPEPTATDRPSTSSSHPEQPLAVVPPPATPSSPATVPVPAGLVHAAPAPAVSPSASPTVAPPSTVAAPLPAVEDSAAPVANRPQTRLSKGIRQPRVRTDGTVKYPIPKAFSTVISEMEPSCYSQAVKDLNWRNAMSEEVNALLKNNTWTLVPPRPSQHVVGCKWVFRIKRQANGSIDRYKARLVAKGFHQQHGIDYGETYSPVIKPTTIRTVLSLAVSKNWPLRQLDVKNAFLHGILQEDVYMIQPPGFVDPSRPHHVCQLRKALYGLKQAPRAWFQRMSSFLLSAGFHISKADSSLFIYRHKQQVIYFLLYVDDIVVTGSDPRLLQSFVDALGRGFDIKDLGPLNYFLGLQVTRSSSGLHLTQMKYAHDILVKHDLLHSQPMSTPLAAKPVLNATDGDLLPNPTLFREIVGSLQYLTVTRPDISYAVNYVAQFMSAPRAPHLVAAKRILRYVKGTLDHGLSFTPQASPFQVSAYSDADWAGCPDSRRSTSGYLIYLGTNLVSWCSKKQPTVARSSAESEYRALAHASAETTWLGYLLFELGAHTTYPIVLYCDNLSTTYMASNPVFHARTKHIELDYHGVREKVALGSHRVSFVPSIDQPADILTKPLYKQRHQTLSSKLVHPRLPSLTGGVSTIISAPQYQHSQDHDPKS